MSIGIMTAIFKTEFRDLPYIKDGESRNAKASTCKLLLLAIADNADDEGQAYPGYTKLVIKTALSRQGIADTLEALCQNGILIISESPSRLGTNDYFIQKSAFPMLAKETDESSYLTSKSQATLPEPVKPLDHNHHLTIINPSLDLTTEEKEQVNKGLTAYLELSQAPGIKAEARCASIQSYLGERLHVNTETKAWREFAKYADGQQQKGEKVETFVSWLLGQKGFDLQYWPPRRMMEMWPQAFIPQSEKYDPNEEFGL
jgi:hypothetical protein